MLSGKLDAHKGTKKIERIAAEVKAQLEAKGKSMEGIETFKEFYGLLQSEAVLLPKKYQPKLRKGI